MNLWHEISPGKNTPEEFNTIIEINRGSKNKYEIDKETGLIALDRVLYTAQDFPFDYGFVPKSYWHDNDPLDVVLLTTHPLMPGIIVHARPVGVIEVIDGADRDDKIIAVPTTDPRWGEVKDLEHVNKHTLKEFEHFFTTYKKIQNKVVEVKGFHNANHAKEIIKEALELYRQKFGNQA